MNECVCNCVSECLSECVSDFVSEVVRRIAIQEHMYLASNSVDDRRRKLPAVKHYYEQGRMKTLVVEFIEGPPTFCYEP